MRPRQSDYIEQKIEAEIADGDRDGALLLIPRADRLLTIEEWFDAGEVAVDELRALLAAWWLDAEGPSNLGVVRWVRLFKAAGFVADRAGTEPPIDPLTVYRGIQGYGRRRGLSWTLDRDRAAWFARRFPHFGASVVLVARPRPRHVLGIFHGREEAEVVVNPRGLRNLREIVVD